MSLRDDTHENNFPAPWNQIRTAVWLIGLAILAWQNWWFPGILVLAAISVALEGFLRVRYPQQPQQVLPSPSPSASPAQAGSPSAPESPPSSSSSSTAPTWRAAPTVARPLKPKPFNQTANVPIAARTFRPWIEFHNSNLC